MLNMPAEHERADPAVAQAAAEWVTRRDRGLSTREAVRLVSWERADPRHSAALAHAQGAWNGLDGLRGVPRIEAMAEEVVRRARKRQTQRRVRRWSTIAIGMAAAVAVGVFGWRLLEPDSNSAMSMRPERVQILASSLRTQILPDGSVAELNGVSRIEVSYSETERRVRLVSGEAHFIVAKNPERPFYVSAGTVTVRAVGTAFNVRLAAAAVEVLVTEGKVQVEPAAPAVHDEAAIAPPRALVAGQRALIDHTEGAAPGIAVAEMGPTEIDEVLAWQGTRLVFNRTTLEDVVAAFNRYNHHRLALGDPRLRERTLTGTFRADNLEGFLRLARHMVDVRAEMRTSTETVLLPAR